MCWDLCEYSYKRSLMIFRSNSPVFVQVGIRMWMLPIAGVASQWEETLLRSVEPALWMKRTTSSPWKRVSLVGPPHTKQFVAPFIFCVCHFLFEPSYHEPRTWSIYLKPCCTKWVTFASPLHYQYVIMLMAYCIAAETEFYFYYPVKKMKGYLIITPSSLKSLQVHETEGRQHTKYKGVQTPCLQLSH